ncbi:MAG: Ldh family oxidoreductase [Hyphomicrobiales bacterium]
MADLAKDGVHLTLEQGHALAVETLTKNGCDEANAHAVARNMIRAEADGSVSHGLFRLPWCVHTLKTGRANGAARPTVTRPAPGVVRVDAHRGFAPLAQETGIPVLVEAARENGIAALAIVDCYHVAAMWPECESVANEGLVAFACTPSFPYVAPAGGNRPLFGTNPIGFGWPRKGKPPMVFDQASAAMARGDLMIAARDGHSVPEGIGIDADGRPSTDPNAILKGAQLAFGGYKGAALAMMVELISGPLIGEFLSIEAKADDDGSGCAPHGGEFLFAIDPARFGDPEKIMAHAEKLFGEIAAQPGARLPGDRRLRNREKTRAQGFYVPHKTWEAIKGTESHN